MVRPVAVVSVAMTELTSGDPATTSIERVFDVAHRAVEASGLQRGEIPLTVSASSDMLEGRPFNFVKGLEALGTWPATNVRHVEMDGAWAAYEAWISMQTGEFDAALVVAWGASSEASLHHVFNAQLDPFTLAPLGLDLSATAALQAEAWLVGANAPPRSLDEFAVLARDAGSRNALLALMAPYAADEPVASPLRSVHCPRYADGAVAIVMAAGDVAMRCARRAWVRGVDHRSETGAIGHRDLSDAIAARTAYENARATAQWTGPPDVAEISASFAHQVPLLRHALELHRTVVNPSGGPLAADVPMANGLIRIGEAALQATGRAGAHQVPSATRTLAHAAAGHCLQQNMVWLLEGDPE
jgi:hypothetical protein